MSPKMENKDQHRDPDHNHYDHEDQSDESLSLSELPLHNSTTALSRRSSSEPQEFFEFFRGNSSAAAGDDHGMSLAEDIIFCGRLVPFRELPRPPPAAPSFQRRSESLSALQGGPRGAAVMRASRSLDYQSLRRGDAVERASPKKATARPRWPALLMFGAVKLPAEMDLGDIKSRQARRRLSGGGGGGGVGGGGRASWRLLKALSCKDHASVAVTASLCMPHV